MKSLLFITILLWSAQACLSQGSNGLVESHQIDQSVNNGNLILSELPIPPPSLIGNFYLFKDWVRGDVTFKNGDKVEDLYLNYDLKNEFLEIKSNNVVKICQLNILSQFNAENILSSINKYENISNYDRFKSGIINIIYEKGDYIFASQPFAYVVEANYNVAIDAGNRNDKVIKKEKYYLIDKSKFFQFKKSNKSVINLKSEHSAKIKKFIKDNGYNCKKENDLKNVLIYLIDLMS